MLKLSNESLPISFKCRYGNAGKMAIPILWQFFDRWESAEATKSADWKQIAELMRPLGLYEKRAKMLIRFSGSISICSFLGLLLYTS